MSYELLKSGKGQKWEKFGPYTIQRPALQAVWPENHSISVKPDALFSREDGKLYQKILLKSALRQYKQSPT
jgi:hypothetical protein